MNSDFTQDSTCFGTEKISRLLLRLAPPVMLAQLVQALYNIIDSYFVGQYSKDGLAALSVIFPIQLLISALAVGTGVGVNTVMSKLDGLSEYKFADEAAGTGLLLSVVSWAIFALVICSIMKLYASISLSSPDAQSYAFQYGMIVCGCSFGIFLESGWSKVLQARGNMKLPMTAQIVGAIVNIILDWLLIFGVGIFPKMGITGAAAATVIGQIAAAIIVGVRAFHKIPALSICKKYIKQIYQAGVPNILMNASCTIYIVALNLILAKFSDDAVAVLGLYYKLQTFYLIPVLGLTTCIVPILSYNHAAELEDRCKSVMRQSLAVSVVCMGIGTLIFELFPTQLLCIFAAGQTQLLAIGTVALRIIGISIVPIAFSLIIPTYFQAVGMGRYSIFLAILRQIILLIPLAWIFSFFGLHFVWMAFPATECITAAVSCILYRKHLIKIDKRDISV